MTSQASRTAHHGREQLRAPITRPLYHTSHMSTYRHHLTYTPTPTIPAYYDGMLSLESHSASGIEWQCTALPVEQIGALCEEIAHTQNETDALRLVSARIGELIGGAAVDVLVDQDSLTQIDTQTVENLSSPSMHAYGADVIEVPLVSGGARLGVLRIVPHMPETWLAYDSNALRLIGAALAQALERHRLRAALDRRATDDVLSHDEKHERWEAFLGRVAHEVKTPLTCINGHAQLVRRYVRAARDAATGDLTLESAARVVDACERHLPPLERQVAHIERLMRGMLDLAQIEHGPLPLTLERCDFVGLLRSALRDVDTFENCKLALTFPDRAMLTCDARRIEQALYDVLHYAIRVGGYGGTLCVGIEERQLNNVRHVMAIIGGRRHPPKVDDCAILSRRELRELRGHVVAGVENVPALLALGLALSATISRVHGGNLYYLPPTSAGGVFVLALPVGGPRAI